MKEIGTPGAYRAWNVEISQSSHTHRDHIQVQSYMDELLSFINEAAADKYDYLKTAVASSSFHMGYIHLKNAMDASGLGYLLTLLMIKYGF